MRALKTLLASVALLVTVSAFAQPVELIGITNKVWAFETNGVDLGTTWREVAYNDSVWPRDRGLFGGDTGYPYPFIVQINGMGGTKPYAALPFGPKTAYYRTHFSWSGSTAGVVFTITNMIDDGLVMYLNNVEIRRVGITADPVVYDSDAANIAEPGRVRADLSLDSLAVNPLVVGDNVLAVEVHQNGTASSDHVFGTSIHAQRISAPCVPAAPANVTVIQCRNATFTAVIPVDCGAPAPTIQWLRNVGSGDAVIDGATNATLTVSNAQPADAGQYFFRLSNASGTTSSGRGQLTVTADTQAPQIVSFVFVGGANNEFEVTYDEPVSDAGGATDNFGIIIEPVGGGAGIPVNSAVRDANNFALVRLTADAGLTEGVAYQYAVGSFDAVLDACANNGTSAPLMGNILQRANILHWTDNRPWRYNQSGANQGTVWKDVGFDDSSWDTGVQGFGNEGAGFPDAPDSQKTPQTRNPEQITYYYRTTFTVPAGAQNVRISARVDDGAAIYVNGTEVGRVNIAANLVLAFDTLTPNLFDPENTGYSPADGILIPNSLLVGGNNVLAIEVHQNSTTSSDVLMLAQITAYVGAIVVEAPVITQDPVSVTVTEGHSFRLTAAATGTSPTYQWYKVGTPNTAIPGATASTYSAVAGSTSGGGYYVIASNSAGNDQSATATVTLRSVASSYGAVWKYETNSQDATLSSGTPWYAPGFNDSAWPSGAGPLGVETTAATVARLPAPIATLLPPPNADFITAYFRATVTAPSLTAGQTLVLTHFVDDGAAVYVDGTLALRYNLTNNPPIYSTNMAPGTAPGDGDANFVSVPITLAAGSHTIAVEVHQNAATSSDIVFGAELRVISSTAPPLTITKAPPAGVTLTWAANPLYSLFSATTVTGPYTHVLANPQGSFTVVNATNPASFFRIGFNGQ